VSCVALELARGRHQRAATSNDNRFDSTVLDRPRFDRYSGTRIPFLSAMA
jgi:hypothetical protein